MSGWQFCIWRSHNTFHVADPVYSKLRTAVDELSLSFWLHTFTRSVTQPAKKQHPGLYWEVELLVSYHHCLSDAHEIEQHSVSYLLVYQMRVASQGFSIYNNLGGDWLQSHFSGEALMSVTTVATSLWIQFLWSYWNEAKTKQNKKKHQPQTVYRILLLQCLVLIIPYFYPHFFCCQSNSIPWSKNFSKGEKNGKLVIPTIEQSWSPGKGAKDSLLTYEKHFQDGEYW